MIRWSGLRRWVNVESWASYTKYSECPHKECVHFISHRLCPWPIMGKGVIGF